MLPPWKSLPFLVGLKSGAFPAGLERLQSSVNNPELKASEVMDGLRVGFNLQTSSDTNPELTIFQATGGVVDGLIP